MRRRAIFLVAMFVGSFRLLSGQEPVCALSDNQMEFAIKSFDQLSPIFLEPRCFNCHGGIIPFVVDEPAHPENGFNLIRNAQGEEDFDATFHPCQSCHGDFHGWRLAPKPMQFKGKDMVGLCTLMKQQFPSDAMAFLDHMTNDRGGVPFLDVAFAGTMGLNAEGKDRLVNTEKLPDPPKSMTRAQMLQLSKDWVEAMGGKFHDPDECGCIDMKYALRINMHGTLQMPGFLFQIALKSAQLPEIPIHFRDDGTFSGSMATPADTSNSGSLAMVSCTGDRTEDIGIEIKGKWPEIQTTAAPPLSSSGQPHQKLQVTVSLNQLQSQANETCSAFGRLMSGSNSTGLQNPGSVQMSLDPVVNATQPVPWRAPMPGWSGEVQATIIRIK